MSIEAMTNDWGAALGTTFALMAIASTIALIIGLPSGIACGVLADASGPRTGSRTGSRTGRGTGRGTGKGTSRGQPSWSFSRCLVSCWCAAMLFSIATPLILHAAAWESTAGKFGWLVKTVTGGNLVWVGWIHGVHGSAIVGLIAFWATRNIPEHVQQHALMDLKPWQIWCYVRLPIARMWIVVGVVLVWLIAATEMSVADLHSVRTVADQFYLFYALDPTMTSVLMVLVIPLLLAVLPCSAWYFCGSRHFEIDMKNANRDSLGASQRAKFAAAFWILASLCVGQGAMFVGLAMQAGHTVRVDSGEAVANWSLSSCVQSLGEAPAMFAQEYTWTAQLSLLTTLLVLPLACVLARASRANHRTASFVDVFAVMVFFIPGPLVGMGIVQLFMLDLPIFEQLATETLVPTMLAVGVRSSVVAYLIMRFGYSQISDSVWQAARMDGSMMGRMFRIELPAIWPALIIAAFASAVIASGDVPSTLPVLPPGVTTVGTRLFGLLHSGSRYQEAALAFWYFATLVVGGAVVWRVVGKLVRTIQ